MKLRITPERSDRIKSALGVAALHALLGWAFLTGLGFEAVPEAVREIKLFDVAPEPPPPPPAEPPPPAAIPTPDPDPKPKDPEGAASPANLRNTPSPIVAPEPAIKLEVPSPVVAAPVAGEGTREAAGAALVPGPGTGSGGVGAGLGSGNSGDGTGGGGGGGGGGIATHARLIRGGIRNSDDPRRGAQSTQIVFLRFVVAPDGRVPACTVTRSSGNRALDEITCRLIRQRFRYRPARDASGRPVAEAITGQHEWESEPEPPPIDYEADGEWEDD